MSLNSNDNKRKILILKTSNQLKFSFGGKFDQLWTFGEKIELKKMTKKERGQTWNSSTRKNDQIIPRGCAAKKKEAASGPPLTERFINEQIIIRERERDV